MNDYSFLNFHEATEKFITSKLKLSTASWFRITTPGEIQERRSFHAVEIWKTFNILKRGKSVHDFQKLTTEEIHTQKPLPVEKKKDLVSMMKYLPEEHRPFYRNICA